MTRRLARPRARLGAALCGVLLAACAPERAPDGRPVVAVSVLPQRFLVERLAGDLVQVEVMIPPGASPATYEPTMGQLRALEEASLYVEVGHPNFPFEATWLDRILSENPGLPVVDSSQGLPRREGDPHIWLVPRYMAHMAAKAEAALEGIVPDAREQLRESLEAFARLTREVDAEIRSRLGKHRGREFFVFHPAWGYFAEEYGLRQVAVEHEHKEPDPRRLAQLVERVKEAEAKVVFVQPQFDPASAETLAREAGARVEVLDPLAEDWPDNLRRAARALDEALSE